MARSMTYTTMLHVYFGCLIETTGFLLFSCQRFARPGLPFKGGGGGHSGTEGEHTLVIKKFKYPLSTDFWPKKHPYFNKNADLFQ